MANRAKEKGDRFEREFAKLIGGVRVPLSGALPGLPGDVRGPDGIIWECKKRKENGFSSFYKWLDKADMLALKADRKGILVVMTYETFEKIRGVTCEKV